MKKYHFVIVLMLSFVTGGELAEDAKDEDAATELVGPNVCIEQVPVNKSVTVSYLESHDVKKYKWCLKVPPRCPVWETEHTTKYKTEYITRIVNHRECCKGYQQVDDRCEPVCSSSCLHGKCVEPEVCSCDPGFSGERCEEVGCPNNNWGQDCSKPCPCSNGGRCEPHTGRCQCLPGWSGDTCSDRCDGDHYGEGCNAVCDCQPGYRCHHVTGDCSPCPAGKYGNKCAADCSCSSNGTALCYHENGNCFCRPNFYGRRCELYCPFGYLDNVCHTKPMPIGLCSCPSDLYRCDEEKGCVCKEGEDCEGGSLFLGFQPLTKDEGGGHVKAVSIIATVLLLALIICVLAVLFYRRRMKRMQKDLEHRSVRYIENSVLDTSNPRSSHNLVVTNSEPYPFELPPPQQQQQQQNAATNNAINNARMLPSTSAGAAATAASSSKNVNIDRFKLGEEEGASCSAYDGASSHRYEEVDDDDENADILPDGAASAETKPKEFATDVNLYYDGDASGQDYSPSKEKNNARLADLYKKGSDKPNVNLVINNTFEPEGYKVEESEHGDEDETDPKTLVRGRSNENPSRFDDDFVGN